jgi:hypothetical protein
MRRGSLLINGIACIQRHRARPLGHLYAFDQQYSWLHGTVQ